HRLRIHPRCDHRPPGGAPGQGRPLPRRVVPGVAVSPVLDQHRPAGRAGRHHPPPARHHRNRVRRFDRWAAGAPTLGSLRRQCRLDPVRGDRPQPAARCRRPGRRPAHPRTRIDATPQDCHRPGPAGPPATPTNPALTHPLALVQTLAYVVAQHDRIQPATIRASLIHLPKGPTETPTGKAGQTSSYSIPTAPTIKITRPSATRPGPSVDPGLVHPMAPRSLVSSSTLGGAMAVLVRACRCADARGMSGEPPRLAPNTIRRTIFDQVHNVTGVAVLRRDSR